MIKTYSFLSLLMMVLVLSAECNYSEPAGVELLVQTKELTTDEMYDNVTAYCEKYGEEVTFRLRKEISVQLLVGNTYKGTRKINFWNNRVYSIDTNPEFVPFMNPDFNIGAIDEVEAVILSKFEAIEGKSINYYVEYDLMTTGNVENVPYSVYKSANVGDRVVVIRTEYFNSDTNETRYIYKLKTEG